MNNHNTLSIDEAKFLKTSKKLLTHLNEEHSTHFKLSQIQEILAQSLGYRNLHDLQKVFSDPSSTQAFQEKSPILSHDIFYNITAEQSIHIIVNLMESTGGGDMWRGRAISLISVVIRALVYMREEKEILLNSAVIREYLILDNLIKLFKTRRDFPDVLRNDLRSYLLSLPGFQESAPKQSDTVMEQHGYLQMQFLTPLGKLQTIENNNFIIADSSWFILENRNKVISASGGSNKKTTYDTETYQTLEINPLLLDFDFLEDTWLAMPEYQDWVESLHRKKQLKEIKLSDLLVYVTTIISPTKSHKMYLVLNSILDNYSVASHISKQITEKLNKK